MKKKILTYLLMLTFVCVGCSNTETDSTSVRTSIEDTNITQTTDTTERVVNELMKLTVSTADTTSDYIINRVAKSGTAFYLEFVGKVNGQEVIKKPAVEDSKTLLLLYNTLNNKRPSNEKTITKIVSTNEGEIKKEVPVPKTEEELKIEKSTEKRIPHYKDTIISATININDKVFAVNEDEYDEEVIELEKLVLPYFE